MADNKHKFESLSPESQQTIDVDVADNVADNDAMVVDLEADTELLSADTVTIQAENVPDSLVDEEEEQTDDDENIDFFDKISIPKLLKKYLIGRDTLYKRMTHLKITPWKVSGRSCLDAEQVAHMDGLHDHIKSGKKMKQYRQPLPTGPLEEQQKTLQLATDEPTTEANVKTPSNIVASPQNGAFEAQPETPTLPTKKIRATRSNADIEQVKLEAQERVRAKRLAVIQVARAYEEDPSQLPPEILQEIEEAEMASISTPLSHRAYYDPNVLAQLAIQSL